MIEVGILLLNHKGSHYFDDLYLNVSEKICLEIDQWLFLIIDNSIDEKESILVRKFALNKSNVKVIFSEQNKGYAHGNNIGLRYFFENKIKYGLIINPDIVFLTNNFISHFIGLIKTNKSISIIGPKLLTPIGNEISSFTKMNLVNFVIDYMPKYVENTTKNVYATTGCCLFLDVNKLKDINYLDENTFLYREEQILAEKLILNNMLWYVLPDIKVIHNHSRKIQSPFQLLWHKFHEYESTKYYFTKYKNYNILYIYLYSLLYALKTFLYFNYVLILFTKCKLKKRFGL